MVQSFIPAVNLEDNRGTQISSVVLNNLFNVVQYVSKLIKRFPTRDYYSFVGKNIANN